MPRLSLIFVVTLAIAGVTLALTWPSPSSNGESDEITGFYENTTEGFSVVIPEGWIGRVNDDNFPLLSIEDIDGNPRVFAELWIFALREDHSAEVWMNAQIQRYGPVQIRDSNPVSYLRA